MTTCLSSFLALFGCTETRKFTWISAGQCSSTNKSHYFIIAKKSKKLSFPLKNKTTAEDLPHGTDQLGSFL